MVISNRRKKARVICVSALAICLSACESLGFGGHPLSGTYWRLAVVDKDGVQSRLNESLQSRHTISFSFDGRIQMQLDCNQGTGSWSAQQPEYVDEAQRGSIAISPIAATRAYCPEPSFGEQMAADLPMSGSFRINPDGNRLVLRGGSTRYVFRRD